MCFPVQARPRVLTTPDDKMAIFEELQNHVPAFRVKSNVPVTRHAIRMQGDRRVARRVATLRQAALRSSSAGSSDPVIDR